MSTARKDLGWILGLGILLCFVFINSGCHSSQTVTILASETPEITSETIQPEEYFQAFPSTSIDLNGEWQFSLDPADVGDRKGWAESDFDDSDWQAVIVPHTWNVMEAFSGYEGVAWYRKHLTLPETVQNAHLRLHFDAIFYKAMVWLNDVYLGEHEGGYTPFEFPISEFINPGGENILAVRVDNLRLPNRIPDDFFDWWHYGGIVRNVSIEATSPVFIDRLQIVAVPHLTGWDEAERATITTQAILVNSSSQVFEGALIAHVIDDTSGEPVLEKAANADVRILPGKQIKVQLEILMENPKLWHFDHPHLYRWVTLLESDGGCVFHEKTEIFGIRLVELKDARLYFNGEPVRLVGMTRHADSPEYGLAEPVSIMAADYSDMKRLNMVLSRPVHYPQHEFILDYCDRNGILLSPEIPAWQIEADHLADPEVRATAKQQLQEMILKDFNHPSIWAWSVANEIDSNTPQGHQYIQELMTLAKELDPARPVGFASYRLFDHPERDATDFTDFVFMNEYAGSWHGTKSDLPRALERIHELWPERVVLISEFGLEAGWTADWWMGSPSQYKTDDYYYIAPDTPPHSEEVYVQREKLILDQMDIFRSYPFVAGAIFWTYQDYRSETDFHMGIVDKNRQRTPVWDVIQDQFSPAWIEEISVFTNSDGQPGFEFQIRSRGPVEESMPAYTLRGYQLKCEILLQEGSKVWMEAFHLLPDLPPGTAWSGEFSWTDPGEDYLVKISILRPLGFSIFKGFYTPEGEVFP
jgi:beta-galactosidase/beta-glucuronidase